MGPLGLGHEPMIHSPQDLLRMAEEQVTSEAAMAAQLEEDDGPAVGT